ncbi:MAG: molybdopterin molybdotransferase MoeA [Bacteroidia bacterium]
MKTIQEARNIIFNHLIDVPAETVALTEGFKRVLYEDIFATSDIPAFNQSAVDGFALCSNYFDANKIYEVIGEIKAGDNIQLNDDQILQYKSFKIFTGAYVPPLLDAIIMKENAIYDKDSNTVRFLTDKISAFQNIRKAGEELACGEKIFPTGTLLDAEHIAVLASAGINKIKVFKHPSVQIIVTGNELKSIESSHLNEGEKYESNGIMLKTLFEKYFGIHTNFNIVPDNPDSIYNTLKNAAEKNDIVITTGGVSVGDYDFTKESVSRLGFKIEFDKVSQKPGKPFVFAHSRNKIIFGLPGNPRAVLSCFYWYIIPYLLKCFKTNKEWILPIVPFKMKNDYTHKDNKSHIVFVKTDGDTVLIQERQGSHMLISSATANGITILDKSIKKNEFVNVYLLR